MSRFSLPLLFSALALAIGSAVPASAGVLDQTLSELDRSTERVAERVGGTVERAGSTVDSALERVPGIGSPPPDVPVDDLPGELSPPAVAPAPAGSQPAQLGKPAATPTASEPAGGGQPGSQPRPAGSTDRPRTDGSAAPAARGRSGGDRVTGGDQDAATTAALERLGGPVADREKAVRHRSLKSGVEDASPITKFIEFVPYRYRIATAVLTVLCLLLALVLIRERVRARKAEVRANTDPLTGLLNRRALDERLLDEWSRAERYDRPLSVLFLDIDDFKTFNDTRGHLAGDQLLRELGARLRSQLRDFDLAARLGGDEFVIVCPETDAAGAGEISSRLAGELAAMQVHVSLGTATREPADAGLADLMRRADRRMYEAKAVSSAG